MSAAATANRCEMAAEPWRDHGMSERSWYRYRALGKPLPPVQHAAHVEAYQRALDPFARLDFRAYVRRCARPEPLAWTPAHLAPVTGAPA